MKVLYYDRHSVIHALAESLVIGGLPMRKDKLTKEKLYIEIDFVEEMLMTLDGCYELEVLKDEDNKDYIIPSYVESETRIEQFKAFGKYYRRGKVLGGVKPGTGHNCMFKGVAFNMVVEFPLYWLKEYQRYHFTDIISSQSTMHKILEFDLKDVFSDEVDPRSIEVIEDLREQYNNEEDKDKKKAIWRRLINSLPDGFTMAMGITMNYLQAQSIYNQRRHHKLGVEWGCICDFFEDLPFFKEFLLK